MIGIIVRGGGGGGGGGGGHATIFSQSGDGSGRNRSQRQCNGHAFLVLLVLGVRRDALAFVDNILTTGSGPRYTIATGTTYIILLLPDVVCLEQQPPANNANRIHLPWRIPASYSSPTACLRCRCCCYDCWACKVWPPSQQANLVQ